MKKEAKTQNMKQTMEKKKKIEEKEKVKKEKSKSFRQKIQRNATKLRLPCSLTS